MIDQLPVPLKTFVIERQSLIAKALHSFLNGNQLVRVVGDATTVNVEDFQRTKPDLVIFGLDNATHEVADALALMRTACPAIRLCVLSSYANPDLMQRTMAAGADGFILKDVSASELDIALRVISSGSTYVDPRVAGSMLRRRYDANTSAASIGELTDREGDILRHIARGLSNKEIGGKLTLSEKTIKNYASRIFTKLNVSARTEAAVFAVKSGYV
jgi:DNA-binding NarL/FixJ family response regulator